MITACLLFELLFKLCDKSGRACQKTELSAWYTFNLLSSTKLKVQSACISCSSVSNAMLAELKFFGHVLDWVFSSPEIVVASAGCLEDCF